MQRNTAYELNVQADGTIGGRSNREYDYPAPLPEATRQANRNRSFKQRPRPVTMLALFTITLLILVLIATVISFVMVFNQLEHIKRNGLNTLTCETLSSPHHGEISIAPGQKSVSHGLGSVATYSCDPGYALVGQSTRTCKDTNGGTVTTGTWSGTPPYCQGKFQFCMYT